MHQSWHVDAPQADEIQHPVVGAVVGLRSVLSDLSRTPVWGLSTAETEAALVEAQSLATQVALLQLRLLAHAERVDVGGSVGATSPANWLAHQTRTTRAAAHRARRLATSLESHTRRSTRPSRVRRSTWSRRP